MDEAKVALNETKLGLKERVLRLTTIYKDNGFLLCTQLGNNGDLNFNGLSANGARPMSDEPFINTNQVKRVIASR